jgi:hypothetical protein
MAKTRPAARACSRTRRPYLHTDYGTETYFDSPIGLSVDTDQVRVGINYLFR